MRIKSYFACSVQSAIGLARKEFGDDVTLVTSHAAPLEARHLGDYEVVFAIEEPVDVAENIKAATQPVDFKNVLREAVAAEPAVQTDIPAKLDEIRSLLIEIGVDASMLRALMTIIQRSVCAAVVDAPEEKPVACEDFDDEDEARPAEPEPVFPEVEPAAESQAAPVEPAAPPKPQFTPAELAFFRSVAVES